MSGQTLAEWVKRRRVELGFRTQAELAAAMTAAIDDPNEDVSVSYVGQIEAARTTMPRQPNLAALASTLETSQAHILALAGVITDHEAGDVPMMGRPGVGEDGAVYDTDTPPQARRAYDLAKQITWNEDRESMILGMMEDAIDLDRRRKKGKL